MSKRVVVRVLAVLSVLALFLNVFLPRVSAEVMTHEKYSMDWSYSNSLGKYIRTEMIKNSSGQIVYCLTLGLKSPNGEDLPEMGKTDNVVYRVLLNGFPQKSVQQLGVANQNEAHYATQLAVWNALGQLDVNELKHENKNVEKTAKAIIDAANNSGDTQDIYMNVIPAEKQKAELKGEFFETNLYTVQTNAKSGSYKVVAKNAPNGVKIVSENGEVKDQLSVGEKFRIQIPKNTKTGEFNLSVAANLTKVQAIAYRGTDTVQNATVLLERNEEKLSSDLAVNWEAAGSLKIKKVGESGEVIGEYKTDKNGEINVKDLAYGKYSFVEKTSANGYVLVTEPIVFEIKEHGKIIELLAVNHLIKGDLEITKVDVADGNNKLPNAEFTIYNEAGKEVVKGKTDDKGIAKFEKLPFGKYTYKETIAPNGYILNEETFSFEIKENGQIIKHIVKDEKIPSIKTTASDKKDGTKEMHTSKSVTIQDKVEYKDLIVGKEYVVKGKLMDKATKKPLLVDGKEVTVESKFTAKEKNGSITLDFTFNASALQGKEVVVFEELYQDNVLVAIHVDIEDKGQTVKFKEVKPEQPKPEQPNQDKNTPTSEQPKEQPQPKKEVQSKIGWLPQTGADLTSWISMAAGALLLIVGGVIFLKRKNA
ncbi:VaFE repeat-containing surface-anchored protein [Bacillus toyonensis]|uniref:VaFE repeat-containing surface-anchored protein n=1 Tax=Bacillus toyonensis TaxID=155322 RepID=UPI0037F1EB74